ncbi:AAA family ATPase [Mycobacterium sp. PSTR-4-N]|uniref:AAA family ATPase n=1 Tax=Mycobacterium sp. PSTR-4-N TaxID=2917745 RepID=UPI001F14A737|nr:LuxR family transcriptional regulator [Mycobacterium sp. PSTR-4-N]MCG7592593.1 LuxR C-terminal-related transcriptional regulator [Mycobacterium sp. PSTR-4-N]
MAPAPRGSTVDPQVAGFLDAASQRPTGLVIEGEAGIGKTTLWLSLVEQARADGFRVLSARVGQAESVMAFAALADLLADVDTGLLAALPPLQRLALDRVLLRAGDDGPATDHRVVAAAFIAVLRALAEAGPVLVAIDDVQWMDISSRTAVAFAARRLQGRFGVLLTERCHPGDGATTMWLTLNRPDGIHRSAVRPLDSAALHTLISERTGRTFSRPTILRIAEISGGNPFFAVELARAIGDGHAPAEQALPPTLNEVVRARIGSLDDQVREFLLCVACLADARVDVLADAIGASRDEVIALVERAEEAGVLTLAGNQVRFSHPLLASGVYADAGSPARRAMHRRLASAVALPEVRARHLALASATGTREIFTALDAAADSARARGAPAAAAELVDLAIGLGGDTAVRRLKSAENHFLAGNVTRAGELLADIPPGEPDIVRALAASLLATVLMYQNQHSDAVELLRGAADDAAGNSAVLIQVLLRLSFALNNIGEPDDARRHGRDAVKLAEELGVPAIISAALAWSVYVDFQNGRGLDQRALRRALECYDSAFDVPIIFRAPLVHALTLSWTGKLTQAHEQLTALRVVCAERGAESDMMAIAGFLAMNHIWRGRFAEAAVEAADAVERAEQLGGEDVLIIPLTVRAVVSSFLGHEDDARTDASRVVAATRGRTASHIADWPGMALCFLEESLGRHREALAALDVSFLAEPGLSTEIAYGWHVPDVIEAMVAVGRLDEADRLTAALERDGAEHDRGWMRAVGARCRAVVLAAAGQVADAEQAAHRALMEHDRLPMPFERARTHLVLGQLQRRLRQKQLAATTLTGALETFEHLGTPLWARRARAELSRTVVAPSDDLTALTPSELRVAEMAASGATNKNIAAAMFISAKTVEHNLTRIYRKLGITSRAELGRRMDRQSAD